MGGETGGVRVQAGEHLRHHRAGHRRGPLNLADFVGTSKAGRGGGGVPARIQLEMRPGSAATSAAAAAAETSSRPPPPRLSLSVAVTRSPGLASKAAASLGGKGSRDRAVAGKLFSYLSNSGQSPKRGDREDRSGGRRVGRGRSSPRSSPRSSEDASVSDGFTSDGAMDTCESDAERGPSTPPRGRSGFKKPPSNGKDPRRHRGERRDDDDDDEEEEEEEENANGCNDDADGIDPATSRLPQQATLEVVVLERQVDVAGAEARG